MPILLGFLIGAGLPLFILKRWLTRKRRAVKLMHLLVRAGLDALRDNMPAPHLTRSYDHDFSNMTLPW